MAGHTHRPDKSTGTTPRAEAGSRFAIVASRYNAEVVDGLLRGAREALVEAGVAPDAIAVFRVPGAFEIPQAARRLARAGQYDAVICLGCLIKGDTVHFEYLASATSLGIMEAAHATDVPMTFGVLTALSEDQARQRSVSGPDNKGREAATAAVELAALFRGIPRGGAS